MLHHPDVQQIYKIITKAVSIFTLVVLLFILQYLFDLNFVCSCIEGYTPKIVFAFIPPLILTFFAILIESYYQKTMFRCQSRNFHWNICGSFILRCFIIYVSVFAVWITTVLFDGALYFCLITSYNETLKHLPCKTNLTSDEMSLKSKYYTESLEYGFLAIGGLLFIWNFIKCFRACCKPGKRNYILPYYQEVYEDLLSEEMNNHLKEELKRIAKKKVKAICNDCIETIEQDELKNDNDNPEADLKETWRKISSSHFYLTENWPRQPAQRRDPTPGLWTLPPENIQLQILPTEEIQFRFLPSNLERDTPGPLAQEGDPMPAPPDSQGDSS